MITVKKVIFETLEELIKKKDAAAVGDIVLVAEEELPFPDSVPYVVAQTGDNLIVVRKNIMSDRRPMKLKNFDLSTWLNRDLRNGILANLSANLRDRVGDVKLLSIGEVYGNTSIGPVLEGEQFEWFKDPINRIARTEDDSVYSGIYWLRDRVLFSNIALVDNSGLCTFTNTLSAHLGVRPTFGIIDDGDGDKR